ncbi:MAG: hypothetical protein VR65_17740 [Desulfobulbaceae bacterium BRH_c16a]|nr:MAG: hypothetical protein VR65_17740 [Desulfobulbaceae bacterium BRH_c16a]
MENNLRRHITSLQLFEQMGFDFSEVVIVPEGNLSCIGEGDPLYYTGGGSGGLTQEQINAIAAVIEALLNAQNASNGAAGNLATLNSLYASLSNLQSAFADLKGQVSSAITTINSSLALVSGYLQRGKALGPQALEMIERQVAVAILQRGLAEMDNKNGQGSTAGDPVLIASGFESYKVEDLNYKALNDLITISRHFRSNQTDLKSSFGRSWFFNYDTNIVAGRKPLIKERENLTEDLRQQAEQLANLAATAATAALDALDAARNAAAAAQVQANEIAGVSNSINSLSATIAGQAASAGSAAQTAAQQAGVAGTSETESQANEAQSAASSAQSAADQASASAGEAAAIASSSNAAALAAAADVAQGEQTTNVINQKKGDVEVILAERTSDAATAADEARQEEAAYPLDPFPLDQSVYFGPGFVKVFTEEGSPILYEEQEEGHYLPVTDKGSYTDEIKEMEGGFRLVSKHGGVREFLHNGRGISLLTRNIDTNNNITEFVRSDDRLTEIIDSVGRKTTLAYNEDGFIGEITDPQGNVHGYTYENDKLIGYTDPMGYNWGYTYDEQARMIGRSDPQNNVYRYSYDENDRVVRETDKEGFEFLYSYNPEERVTRVTDRRGLTTRHYYHENNRLERTLFPDGSEIAYAYDGRNNIVTVRDENGKISAFNYNAKNDVTVAINALGERTELSYEPTFNKVATITDPLGRTRSFSYDNRGNLTTITHPDGSSRTIGYNDLGLPAAVTDENSNTTTLDYTAYGQLAEITNPDGTKRSLTSDILNRITSVTDELGATTSFTYNPLGSMVHSVDPLGAETKFIYDELQHKIQAINALGNATSYEYSRRGNLLRETDPLGNAASYVYDGNENMIGKTFPNNTGIDFAYDQRNRLVQELTVPGNLETLHTYDAKGQKIAVRDANGNTTAFSYDAVGRPTGKTDATGALTSGNYDAAGNLVQITDGNGNPIHYSYDVRNRMISQSNALGNTTAYKLDTIGNLLTKHNPDGTAINFLYDSRNQLTTVRFPDAPEKIYTYDAAGRMIRMANETTAETREYDARGRLLTTIDSYTGRIDYDYDPLGNRIRMIDPDNGVFTYAYDAKNRLTGFTDPEGKTTSYTFDVMGRVTSTALPNNTETVSEYDTDNRLARMITTSAKDGQLASFAYTYDAVGNKLTMTEEDGGLTSYQYDAAYRLTHVEYPQRVGQIATTPKNNCTDKGKGKKNGHHKTEDPLPASVSYVYDAAGNRINEIVDNRTIDYHYNAANQLLQAGDIRYSYDDNGNRVSKQDQDGLSRYRYTPDNFLAGFDNPQGESTEYGYDAMNRRVFKAAGEKEVTSYLYDGLEVLQEISGENSQKIAAYYRANGRIVTRQEYNVSQGNDNYQHRPEDRQLFYAYDGLGSVVALSNHQGKEKTRYHYDAFGKVIDGDLSENQYTFTGRQLDPESGLYHFHFRHYDAEAGVWTTPDPIGVLGGVNLYGYANSNPVNVIDPFGLWGAGGAGGENSLGGGGEASNSLGSTSSSGGSETSAGSYLSAHKDELAKDLFGEIDFGVDLPDDLSSELDNVDCDTSNFWGDVWGNYQETNNVIGLGRMGLTTALGGFFAKTYGGYSLGQYAFGGVAKHLGTHIGTIGLVAKTTTLNAALIQGSFQAGIFAGSIINVAAERLMNNEKCKK